MSCWRVCLLLNNFSQLNWVALQVCGKLDGHIDGLPHMLGTMYQWCVVVSAMVCGNSHIRRPGYVRPVVQTHAKIHAWCEQRWLPKHHLGKKSGHMLHLLWHQGPLETMWLQKDSDHVCLWPGYHTTTPTSTATLVSWKSRLESGMSSVVFRDESRFCLYMSYGCTHVRRRPGEHNLPECVRPRHIGPTSGFMVWGPSGITRGHI